MGNKRKSNIKQVGKVNKIVISNSNSETEVKQIFTIVIEELKRKNAKDLLILNAELVVVKDN